MSLHLWYLTRILWYPPDCKCAAHNGLANRSGRGNEGRQLPGNVVAALAVRPGANPPHTPSNTPLTESEDILHPDCAKPSGIIVSVDEIDNEKVDTFGAFVASLHLYCMYGYTVTLYYTCTVDSRTDPKSGTVFFSFRFHASTHHCRYYCLFLAVNYKNTLPPPPSSFFASILVHRPRPTSSGRQRPQYRYLVPMTNILSPTHPSFLGNFSDHGNSPNRCQSLC